MSFLVRFLDKTNEQLLANVKNTSTGFLNELQNDHRQMQRYLIAMEESCQVETPPSKEAEFFEGHTAWL